MGTSGILTASIVLLAAARVGQSFRLTILHTNDMHARIEEVSTNTGPCSPKGPCFGGFARLAAEVKTIRQEQPNNTIFLNAGDSFQGTPYYFVFKWKVIAAMIDRIGIDVMSLGNHEFDDGVAGLDPYLRKVKTPSVAANLDLTDVPSLAEGNIHPSFNLNVNGVNISVIGYVTPDTKDISAPGPVKFLDEIPILKMLAKEAKAAGAKIVIALGHSGFEMDKEIAAQVPEVDVVVGGHTDTFLYTGTPPNGSIEKVESVYPHMVTQGSGKRVPVVQAYGYTKYLGRLELEFDGEYKLTKAYGNPILLDSSKPQDPDVLSEIQLWKANLTAGLDHVVARKVVDLDGSCRGKECNLGNFYCDAMVDYRAREMEGRGSVNGWTDAPMCITNGGGIRTSFSMNETGGEFTERDILTVIPFDNNMVKVTITGKGLMNVLEKSVEKYDIARMKAPGGFLQVSGIHVKYDLSKPPGQRVASANLRCGLCMIPVYQPLDLMQNYNMLISEYLFRGGDGYSDLKNITHEEMGWRDTEAFRSFATKSTPMYPSVDERIVFLQPQERQSSSGHKMSGYSFLFVLIVLVQILNNR